MKHFASFLKALLIVLILIPVSCQKDNKKGEEILPDPKDEKKEAQENYDAAVKLLESGPSANFSQALKLFEQSAQQGSDSAQVAAGALLEYGLGTSADMSKAREYYRKAADQGNREAKEKLRMLEISKSKLVVPSGFSTPLNEVMVWNGDTLRVLNGDASFFSSEKSVTVVDKELRPVYVSFRALEGKSATEPVNLDARETAVSLLLMSIPYGLSMENDYYQTLLREMVDGFPETTALAKAIETSVGKNGHMVYEEFKKEMDAAVQQVNKALGLDKIGKELPGKKLAATPKDPASLLFPAPSPQASAATRGLGLRALNKPEIAWGDYYFYGELRTQLDGDYSNGSSGREWKVTVANEMPMFFYVEHGTIDEMGMSSEELKEWRQSQGLSTRFEPSRLLKAVNLSKYFDMVGVNGTDKLNEAFNSIFTDFATILTAWGNGERADYFDKSFGKQMVSVWVPIETDRDVLFISSMDRRPEIFLAGLFDIVIFPALAQYFSSFSDSIYAPLLESFLVNTESGEMVEMAQAMLDLRVEEFIDLFNAYMLKWFNSTLRETLADLMNKGLVRVTALSSMASIDSIYPDILEGDMPVGADDFLAELKALFTIAKWAEIAANTSIWLLYQLTIDSYSVGFSIQADGVPDALEAVEMGLSVKWASCNVGASSQWGGGKLYAWGETQEKNRYEWDNYKWGTGLNAMTKYDKDGLSVLLPEDDAATKVWGEKWRTPTAEEFRELIENCTLEVRNLWGQRGYFLTSKITGNCIYLPSAGSSELSPVLDGNYWTASLYDGNSSYARTFEFTTSKNDGTYGMNQFRRNGGKSVRGVQDYEKPKLKVSKTYLVFEETIVGQSSQLEWTITNVGNARLDVSSLSVPEGFSTDFASWTAKSLAPNESHTFKVSFNPTEVKDYSGKMVLKSNASNAPEASFTIGGKGAAVPEAKLKVSKTSLEFDETIVGQSSQLEWTITNVGNITLTVSSLTVPSGFSTDFTSWSSKSLEPNESHTFKVAFRPTEIKDYSGKMVLKSNASNAPEASFTIGGKGVAAPEAKLKVSKTYLEFDETIVGQSSVLDWTITNVGNTKLTVSSLTVPSGFSTDFSSWNAKSLEPNESHTFKVTFKPTEVKDYSGKMVLKSNASNAPEASFTIGGKGVAVPEAKLKVSKTYLEFDETIVGQSSQLEWTITNVGNAKLTVSSLTVPSGFSTDFSSWSSKSLEPNESHTFKVTFKPTEVKDYSGKMVLKSNASNAPEASFTIGGKGVAVPEAKLKVSRTYLAFEETIVGQSSQLEWTITNVGNAKLTVSSLTVPSGFSTDFSSWTAKSLEPNESHTFKVTFKPTEVKDYSGKMVLKSNASNAPEASFTIGGKGVAVPEAKLKVSKTYLEFEETIVGQSSQLEWTITNVGNAKLTVSSLTVPSGFSTDFSSWSSKSLEPNESHTFKVTFKPTEVKDYSGKMVLKSNASNAPEASFTIGGKGLAAGDPIILSYDHQFGRIEIGTTRTYSMLVKNEGDAPLVISSISFDLDVFSVDLEEGRSYTINPGGGFIFNIDFTPKEKKVYNDKLTFISNASNASTYSVEVSGEGIDPVTRVKLSERNIDFGSVPVGGYKEHIITATNVGIAAVTFTGFNYFDEAAFRIDEDCIGKSISPDESMPIKVIFNPQLSGAKERRAYVCFNNTVVEFLDITGDATPVVNYYAEAVDMGLSVKWSSCFLGTNNAKDYGARFAWGETDPKDSFSWSNYKWCNGTERSLTKYDGYYHLEPEDDAASVNLGNGWRMPTAVEQEELINNCDWTMVWEGRDKWVIATSKINGNKLYFRVPFNTVGMLYGVWSSTCYAASGGEMRFSIYGEGDGIVINVAKTSSGRYAGQYIRPVKD